MKKFQISYSILYSELFPGCTEKFATDFERKGIEISIYLENRTFRKERTYNEIFFK